jgi:hypothetical protein
VETNEDETPMRVSYLSLASLFAASTLLSADVVSGSVSCSAPSGDYGHLTPVSQTSSSHCGVQTSITNIPIDLTVTQWSDHELASARVSGSYSLSSNEISVELDGMAYAYPHSSATAQITFSDTFSTDGPLRTGIVRGIFQPYTFRYGGMVSTSLVSPTLPYPTFGPSAPAMTFELGQTFTLTMIGSAVTSSDDGTPSTAQFQMPLNLAFFEADGVTPVALTEVTAAPEPSTWASLAAGLVMLACWRRRQSRWH